MSAENRRILIIDDERPILLTLEALLCRHGYQPEEALEKQSHLRETEQLRQKTQQLEKRLEIAETRLAPVVKSKAMQEIQELVDAMSPSEANVLITGESGVGKEVIANVIHSRSRRADKSMIKLNCAAFPQAMIESELFGYVKGAFTGAMNDFPGMIAAASGSTLFLDEISEMPAELQTRFLRVLQEREYRPLGSTKTLKADFRVIAATNRPIASALAENRLRSDLYYRLNTFQIEIPPLRERKEDIPPLVGTFLKRFAQELGKAEPE